MKKGFLVLACVLGLVTIGVASAQSVNLPYFQALLNNWQQRGNMVRASQPAQLSNLGQTTVTTDGRSGASSVAGGACAAGQALPRGTFGQIFYCNGSRWVAGSSVWTNGQTVRLANLAGAGGAYVCADAHGNLFRSATNCDIAPTPTPPPTTVQRAEVLVAVGEGNGFRSVVYTSPSAPTPDVTLGTFRLRSQNQTATINGLTFVFNRSNGSSPDPVIQNIRLMTPSGTYSPSSVNMADGRIVFANLSIQLPQDQWKDVVLKVDVLAGVHGSTITKLLASGITGAGANFGAISLAAGVGDVAAGNVAFTVYQVVTRPAEIATAIGSDNAFRHFVYTSLSSVTPDVSLGGFRLKSANQDATINSLSFMVSRSNATPLTSIISNVRLSDGANTYNAASVSADGRITFNNLNIRLAQDQWRDLFLRVDVLPGVSYVSAIARLSASSITGVSANNDAISLAADATDVSATDVIFRPTP
jgi:hypothetical protein